MGQIRAIITDFDGTLVNTYYANFEAYRQSFKTFGYKFDEATYFECYGLRYDDMIKRMGITDVDHIQKIRQTKQQIYPDYFKYCDINNELLQYIRYCRQNGMLACIASTAAKQNLFGLIEYHRLGGYFDIILSGEAVSKGKPDPEVYLKALKLLKCEPDEALVFEDSDTGCEAAKNAGINYVKINKF